MLWRKHHLIDPDVMKKTSPHRPWCYEGNITSSTLMLWRKDHLIDPDVMKKTSPHRPWCYEGNITSSTLILWRKHRLIDPDVMKETSPLRPWCYEGNITSSTLMKEYFALFSNALRSLIENLKLNCVPCKFCFWTWELKSEQISSNLYPKKTKGKGKVVPVLN
jgi:hypothetical protein